MTTETAIQAIGLRKQFGGTQAVRDGTFTISPGEIFSLLGPNGAGKTTTIAMLSGLLRPDSGEAFLMGHSVQREPARARSMLGVVPQEVALYMDLSAQENLVFWGKMYGLRGKPLARRVDEVLEMTGLTERRKERVGAYSGGMKRRVNIGVALLHKPPVVFMDEPTVGIDPQSRRHILDEVKELNRQGMTILYTTHYMEEAQELSHRIAIMDQGVLVATGTHEELVRLVGEKSRIELTLNADSPRTVDSWKAIPGVTGVAAEDGHITVHVADSNSVLPLLFEAAGRQGVRITAVEIREPNLESVFLHLTGRALRD
jgi:ABC-2 type transport system ATP-binding protein